jgi:hypothetical protein
MALIDDAIAALKLQDLGEQLVQADFVKKWRVNRAALSRRWWRVTGPRSDGYAAVS